MSAQVRQNRLYTRLSEHRKEEAAAAIDSAIHETAYFRQIRDGCGIFFIPKPEGEELRRPDTAIQP